MNIQLTYHWNKGLGTELCALSTFLHIGVTSIESNNKSFNLRFDQYKDIFDIQTIRIVDNTDITEPFMPNDFIKLFSPYYKKNRKKISRNYIGISLYSNLNETFDYFSMNSSSEYYHYPKCKWYPIEEYSNVVQLIKKAGYDVISLDSKSISIKEKAYLIENLCECVIGYEGGIAHLCHMLDVPYIMFPWRIKQSNYLEEILHLDNKTYFLDSIYELLNWKNNERKQLQDIIFNLNSGNGNNRFLNNSIKLYVSPNFNFFTDTGIRLSLEVSAQEKDFFKKHKEKFNNFQIRNI